MTEAISETLNYVFNNLDIDNTIYEYAKKNYKLNSKIEHHKRINKDIKIINTIMDKKTWLSR